MIWQEEEAQIRKSIGQNRLDRPMYEESPTIPIQIFKPWEITIRPFQTNIVDNSL